MDGLDFDLATKALLIGFLDYSIYCRVFFFFFVANSVCRSSFCLSPSTYPPANLCMVCTTAAFWTSMIIEVSVQTPTTQIYLSPDHYSHLLVGVLHPEMYQATTSATPTAQPQIHACIQSMSTIMMMAFSVSNLLSLTHSLSLSLSHTHTHTLMLEGGPENLQTRQLNITILM